MISPARLEAYMRRAAALDREAVEIPPFVLFFDSKDPLRFFNYARPGEPNGRSSLAEGTLREPLEAVRAAFVARRRMPRFEFTEEFAPRLPSLLQAAGFAEEGRYLLMVCNPESFRLAPEVPGLRVVSLTTDAPDTDLEAFEAVQDRGFAEGVPELDTDAEGGSLRSWLEVGNRAFLAKLDGLPVGVATFTVPLDGLTELTGITTLPAYRRRGIAAAATAYATQAAFAFGVEVAFLTAADARAGRVYERVGFRPYATMLAYCEPSGA